MKVEIRPDSVSFELSVNEFTQFFQLVAHNVPLYTYSLAQLMKCIKNEVENGKKEDTSA